MRKCPKCGEEYTDADFRTLCSNCMINLEVVVSTASQEAASDTGPIQVGGPVSELAASPAPVIPTTITLPEVTIPDFSLPEVAPPTAELPGAILPSPEVTGEAITLEPRAPDPRPGPYKPPLTPQPNPAIPQPPVIPLPQPEREPAVPSPVPSPMPRPAPQPVPQPSPMPQPAPMPQPVPQPEPSEPAPTASVGRALGPEELASGRSMLWMNLVLGTVCGTIALSLLVNPSASIFRFIFLVLTGWLTYYFIRQALYRSAVRSVTFAPKDRLRLAEPMPMEAAVTMIREVRVSDVEITLTGEERAVKGSGKSTTTSRHAFYTQTVRIPSPPSWPGGYELLLAAMLPAPPSTAPPSFAGRKNFIEWSASLRVALIGLPDVRERVALTVVPARNEPPPPNAQPTYRLPELEPLNAQIGFTSPVDAGNMPIFEAGREVPFTLRMNPPDDFSQQRVFVELAYMINGSGDHENSTIARQSFPIRSDGTDRLEHGVLAIPRAAPITYDGTHLRIHWAVTVRHEQPWGRDHRQVFEVLVVPACEG